jgi:hypothetical protein
LFKAERRAIALAFVVVALGCALDAAVARAGTYEVAVCHDPATGLTAPTDGISFPTTGALAAAGVYEGCGGGGYLFATLDGVATHGAADQAAWVFQAPAGTTIAGAQVFRAFSVAPSAPDADPIDVLEALAPDGAASVLDQCAQVLGCSASGSGPATPFAASDELAFGGLTNVAAIEGTAGCGGGLDCAAGGGAACPELGGDPCLAGNHLYGMVVTLEDDTAPTPVSVSGALVTPGVLAGVANVSFDATDSGSGLYSAAIDVDGTQVTSGLLGAGGGHCVPLDAPGPGGVLRFGWTVPCPLAGGGTLSLDTSVLHDGTHQVAVTVTDAAGNTATVWSGAIETENAPQGGVPAISGVAQAGQTLLAAPGSWSPQASGYAYQWESCDAAGAQCAPIPGATAAAYTVTRADAYGQLEVAVTAADAEGSTSAVSAPTGVVLDADGYTAPPRGPLLLAGSLPQISGGDYAGATLSATPGSWSGAPSGYSYQWERCDTAGLGCAPIPGAVSASYVLGAADVYERVRVLVDAAGAGGTSDAASELTHVIAAGASGGGGAGAEGGGAPAASGGPSGAGGRSQTPNGSGACKGARLQAGFAGRASVSVALGRSVTMRGRLHCGSRAIKGALLELAVAPAAGAGAVRRAQIRTSADGSFAYVLGSGPSRRITVTYHAFGSTGAPTAKASARLLVTPQITLAITPTQTSNGHTITFTGRVAGGHLPRGGLPLELEYLEGKTWMMYVVVRASGADGRFVYRYTFRRTTQPITYTFRFVVPSTGVAGYPYRPGTSPARSVHVVP